MPQLPPTATTRISGCDDQRVACLAQPGRHGEVQGIQVLAGRGPVRTGQQADHEAAFVTDTASGRSHDAVQPAGHHGEASAREQPAHLAGQLPKGRRHLGASRADHGDDRTGRHLDQPRPAYRVGTCMLTTQLGASTISDTRNSPTRLSSR